MCCGGTPWFGNYHYSYEWEGEMYSSYGAELDFEQYLEDNISSIKICEGITGIGALPFRVIQAGVVYLPSTLEQIDEQAFRDSTWLMNLLARDPEIGYRYPGTSKWDPTCVDVLDAGGHTWRLVAYVPD